MKPFVKINVFSKAAHTSMIITGFDMLSKREIIDVEYNLIFDQAGAFPHNGLVEAEVEGKKIAFDVLDGYNFADLEKMKDYINGVDCYFKRSFSPKYNLMFEDAEIIKKIFPLGFNYFVTFKNNPIQNDSIISKLKNTVKKSNVKADDFETEIIKKEKDFKILFLSRLWNPAEFTRKTSDSKENIDYINQMRIDIVKALRQTYSSKNLVCAIHSDDYSKQLCPDILAPKTLTVKGNYVSVMKSSDICIGSMGLHESIGWKTGEYVAASKAIVNEKFRYDVVGDFEEGKNYLPYDNVEACLKAVAFLNNNPDKVFEMKQRNKKYYDEYLRPDMQILNALKKVISC